MKPLSQYPVSFPFGATTAPYSPSNPHKGDDRAAPAGTPIDVNGVTIGLVGSTGYSTGNHCHIGRFVGGVAINPNSGGFKFTNAVVTEVAEDKVNGKYVRVQADGNSWVYLHMSSTIAKVGDILKVMATDALTKEEIILSYAQAYDVLEKNVNQDVVKAFTGKPLGQLLNFIKADPSYQAHFKQVNTPAGYKPVTKQLYEKV